MQLDHQVHLAPDGVADLAERSGAFVELLRGDADAAVLVGGEIKRPDLLPGNAFRQKITRQPWNHYDEQSEAYLHYVLARAGKGKKARILKLVEAIPATATGEQAEDRYMLQAALYLAGDRRFEKQLKTVDTSVIAPQRINSWSFYSDRRR